jgi:hypothetical protein
MPAGSAGVLEAGGYAADGEQQQALQEPVRKPAAAGLVLCRCLGQVGERLPDELLDRTSV